MLREKKNRREISNNREPVVKNVDFDFSYLKNIEHKPIETKIIGKTFSQEEAIKCSKSKRGYYLNEDNIE